jgi:hypothetical protein
MTAYESAFFEKNEGQGALVATMLVHIRATDIGVSQHISQNLLKFVFYSDIKRTTSSKCG